MPLDDTNWFSGDTAQVAAISGTEQTRQGGERPPLTDETTALPSEQSDATRLLICARSLLERGWCKRIQAKDATGENVDPTSDRAAVWCAFGALVAAGMPNSHYYGDIAYRAHPAFIRLTAAIGGGDIASFNNHQETVEPVLAAFDRAIAGGPAARIPREPDR